MKNRGCLIRNHKLRGEWAELRFMAKAAEYGLRVSRPISENTHYDVALEHHGQFLRVQVKSTMRYDNGAYMCKVPFDRTGRRRNIVIPEDAWYILPSRAVVRLRGNVGLEPTRKGQKYERYLEAWHLLRRASERRAKKKRG